MEWNRFHWLEWKNVQKRMVRVGETAELSETLQISVEFLDKLIYIECGGN